MMGGVKLALPTAHAALPASAGAAGEALKPLIYVTATRLLRRLMMNLCVSQIYFGEGRGEENGAVGGGVLHGAIISHHSEFTTRTSIAGPLLLTAVFHFFFDLANSPQGLFCFFLV